MDNIVIASVPTFVAAKPVFAIVVASPSAHAFNFRLRQRTFVWNEMNVAKQEGKLMG